MAINEHPDDELLNAAINGDQDALSHLLQASATEVRHSIQGKIDSRWKSVLSEDDVMQQTYADRVLVRYTISLNWPW